VLVEHVFVTTKEAADALAAAGRFLENGGFHVEAQSERLLELRRGCKKAAKAKSITELPQEARIEFDRGRVTVAVLTQENRKAGPMHRDLLMGIAQGIEDSLVRGVPDAEARRAWSEAEVRIAEDLARRRRHTIYFVAALCIFLFTCFGWILGLALKFW
jgi:hypothetical protein